MTSKNIGKYSFSKVRVLCVGFAVLLVLATLALHPLTSSAASNSDFTQTINAGTLVTDIRDNTGASVTSPSVAFGAASAAFSCLTGGARPQATFGTNTERIYVDNPNDVAQWSLTIAASSNTDVWENAGATATYDFNDPDGSGDCTDGADADSVAGQLFVDPTGATITADCSGGFCDTDGVTTGSSSATYAQGTTDNITLMQADNTSDAFGRWYLTGVDMRQSIPAGQVADDYTLNLVLTIAGS